MRYWGKVLGVVLALFAGLGFWGVVLGFLVGHLFDKANARRRMWSTGDQQQRQSLFFNTTFEVMGHLTKAKGRVTEADIHLASALMDRMRLQGEGRAAAQRAFRIGKESDYPLRDKLRQLRVVCGSRFDLVRMFLEIQIQAAFADGSLHPNERQVLYIIGEELGISRGQFDQFLRMMEGGQQFGGGQYQYQSQGNQGGFQQQRGPTLEDACNVLGVKSTDDPTTIKRAYRKLMTEHHPDKLVAKGLPPEMMQMAQQKAQEIQAAYDLIKTTKGFK